MQRGEERLGLENRALEVRAEAAEKRNVEHSSELVRTTETYRKQVRRWGQGGKGAAGEGMGGECMGG